MAKRRTKDEGSEPKRRSTRRVGQKSPANEPGEVISPKKKRRRRSKASTTVEAEVADAPKRNRRLRPIPVESSDAVDAPSREGLGRRFGRRSRAWLTSRRFALRRPLALILRTLVAVAVVAGGFAGYRLIERYAHTAPYFEVQEIAIDGLERLERETLLSAAGIAEGDNVFARSPARVEARIEDHPWIADATVERRLPGTFRVQVVERRAVAILALDTSLYLVGDDGALFKELGPTDPADLPVLTGIDTSAFRSDVRYRSDVLLEAVALMHDVRNAGLGSALPLGEIHFEQDGGLSMILGDAQSAHGGLSVRLSRGPYAPKLRRLRRVLERLDESGAEAEYVFLDNVRRPDRVTVRLRQLPDAPQPEEAEETT